MHNAEHQVFSFTLHGTVNDLIFIVIDEIYSLCYILVIYIVSIDF